MDDTVVADNVHRVGRSSSKVIGLSDDGIIDKRLAESASVCDLLSI